MDPLAQHCLHCGDRLVPREVFGRPRPTCSSCDWVYFEDRKVAVGVVAERDHSILLTRRNHEPMMGSWSFPSGFVDAGEDVREAAVREAFEETAIPVEIRAAAGRLPGDREAASSTSLLPLERAPETRSGCRVDGSQILSHRGTAPARLLPRRISFEPGEEGRDQTRTEVKP